MASRESDLSQVFEAALVLLGREIRDRNSVRPTTTDIARIGCEDPEVKAWLKTPIEMSRRLQPSFLLDRYSPTGPATARRTDEARAQLRIQRTLKRYSGPPR